MADEKKPEAEVIMEDLSKKPWLSKTIWFNLLISVAAFIPSVQAYVHGNEEVVVLALSGVNMILRLVTSGSIKLGN